MQTQTSSAQRLTAAALTGLIAQGQGRISSIYLHWTAGRYGQLFADYHSTSTATAVFTKPARSSPSLKPYVASQYRRYRYRSVLRTGRPAP